MERKTVLLKPLNPLLLCPGGMQESSPPAKWSVLCLAGSSLRISFLLMWEPALFHASKEQ